MAGEMFSEAFDQFKRAVSTPQARKIRHQVANGLIMALPIVAALPPVKRTKLGKAIEYVGGTALIMRVAEMIRDWEPGEGEPGEVA